MTPTPPRLIAPSDDVTGFTCGRPALDNWLISMALRAERDHTARTYVSFDDNAPHSRVIGYYCLSSYSVERLSIGGGYLARNAPPAVPAILLGRLAVDITWQGKGLGASLLHDAVNNAELVSRRIGSRALVVDALDEPAAAFYRRYGFHPFPSNPFKLFHRF